VLSSIDTFVANVETDVNAAFNALFTALEGFQNGLYEDMNLYQDEVAQAGMEALTALADGNDLDGAYPASFFDGIGGALDDFRDGLDAAQGKALDKVRKKLEKVATKLAKTTERRLSWFLEPAVRCGKTSSLQAAVMGATRVPLVLHTALALGSTGGTVNGYIRVAGIAEDAEAVTVRVVNEGTLDTEGADFFELGSPFWHVLLDADKAGLPDGNLLVVAEQGTSGSSLPAFVSIR
jgi:hypothetical protein